MKLIELTAPNGDSVFINPDMVCTVSHSEENKTTNRTRIIHTAGMQYVAQEPREVVNKLMEDKS